MSDEQPPKRDFPEAHAKEAAAHQRALDAERTKTDAARTRAETAERALRDQTPDKEAINVIKRLQRIDRGNEKWRMKNLDAPVMPGYGSPTPRGVNPESQAARHHNFSMQHDKNNFELEKIKRSKKRAGPFSWIVGLGALAVAAVGAHSLSKADFRAESPIASGPSEPEPPVPVDGNIDQQKMVGPEAGARDAEIPPVLAPETNIRPDAAIERDVAMPSETQIGFLGLGRKKSAENHYELRYFILEPGPEGVDTGLDKDVTRIIKKESERAGTNLIISQQLRSSEVIEKNTLSRTRLTLKLPEGVGQQGDARDLVVYIAEVTKDGKTIRTTNWQAQSGEYIQRGFNAWEWSR